MVDTDLMVMPLEAAFKSKDMEFDDKENEFCILPVEKSDASKSLENTVVMVLNMDSPSQGLDDGGDAPNPDIKKEKEEEMNKPSNLQIDSLFPSKSSLLSEKEGGQTSPHLAFGLALQSATKYGTVLLRCVMQIVKEAPTLFLPANEEDGHLGESTMVPLGSSNSKVSWKIQRGDRTFALQFATDTTEVDYEFRFLCWSREDCNSICQILESFTAKNPISSPKPSHFLKCGELVMNDTLDTSKQQWKPVQVQIWQWMIYVFNMNCDDDNVPRTVITLGSPAMKIFLEPSMGFSLRFENLKFAFRAQTSEEQQSWVNSIRREHVLRCPAPPMMPPPPSISSPKPPVPTLPSQQPLNVNSNQNILKPPPPLTPPPITLTLHPPKKNRPMPLNYSDNAATFTSTKTIGNGEEPSSPNSVASSGSRQWLQSKFKSFSPKSKKGTKQQQITSKMNASGMPGDDAIPRRLRVLNELVATEQKYVDTLRTLHTTRHLIASKHENHADLSHCLVSIFGDVHALSAVHTQLAMDLTTEVDISSVDALIGHVLHVALKGTSEYYERFAANAEEAKESLKQLLAEPSMLKIIGQSLGCGEGDVAKTMDSLLIQPIQRPPRYILLLQELLRCTDADHHDFKWVVEAHVQAKAVAHGMNEEKREHENMSQLRHLASRIVKVRQSSDAMLRPVNIVSRNRRVVKEGLVMKVHRYRDRERILILLSDLLLIAVPAIQVPYIANDKLTVHRVIHLRQAKLRLITDAKGADRVFVIVLPSNKTFAFKAASSEARNAWTSEISEILSTLRMIAAHSWSSFSSSSALLPPTADVHRSKDAALVLRRLLSGSLLTKFSRRNGTASIRWVVVSEDLKSISWGKTSNNERRSKVKIKKIEFIRYGASTASFFLDPAARKNPEWLCFSFGVGNKTMDFAAKNLEELMDWCLGIQGLMQAANIKENERLDESKIEAAMLNMLENA